MPYRAVMGNKPGLLFIFSNGLPFIRWRLVLHLEKVLTEVGTKSKHFARHCFCIVAATKAASIGVEYSTIKTLGQWVHLHIKNT